MSNFNEMKNNQKWYSDPFFAFWKGYKMRLLVDANDTNGDNEVKGTRVSIFLYLMKGPYDDELEQSGHWPLKGMFKVELLDQVNDGKYTVFLPAFDKNNSRTYRIIEGDMVLAKWVADISHEDILHSNYLKHDSLYFMISYQSFSASKQNDEHVAPVPFKISNFILRR